MLIFNIKNIRLNKNISLYRLSKETNLSRTYLRDLENNVKTNPSVFILEKIAVALNVNIKDLFYSELDIATLKRRLYRTIDKYGVASDKTLQISQIIDLLINIKNN